MAKKKKFELIEGQDYVMDFKNIHDAKVLLGAAEKLVWPKPEEFPELGQYKQACEAWPKYIAWKLEWMESLTDVAQLNAALNQPEEYSLRQIIIKSDIALRKIAGVM